MSKKRETGETATEETASKKRPISFGRPTVYELVAIAVAVVFMLLTVVAAYRESHGGRIVYSLTLSSRVTPSPDSIVNINTATIDELMTLDGIGETYARRIVDYRERYGDFETIDDIMEVAGIGEGRFEKIRESITV